MSQQFFNDVKNISIALIRKQKKITYTKILSTHLLAGLVTLSFCPQFGFDPFNAGENLSHYFLNYGHGACGFFCGALFYGSGSLLSVFVLSKRDLLYFTHQNFKKSLLLISIFYVILMIIGRFTAEDFIHFGLEFSIFWILGAIVIQGMANLLTKPRLRFFRS